MKKIISLILTIMIISLSLITAHAEPEDPELYVGYYFKKYYSTVEEENTLPSYSCKYFDSKYFNRWVEYYLIDYSSSNAIDEPYFNRFGNSNEYYEYSNMTNYLFESGLTVFIGTVYFNPEDRPENHNDDFYSLEEIASQNPSIIDTIIEKQLTKRVGYIGDADCDGEVTVLDATTIQRHLAQIDVLKVELANDIDDNGYVDVMDATAVQRHIAELE